MANMALKMYKAIRNPNDLGGSTMVESTLNGKEALKL